MAVKIKLKRIGKMREPHYRIVVADARTKRGGRAIEEIGQYHPQDNPSRISVDSERALYWLGVGAQPTEAVAAILRVTGDWQAFKGQPAPPPMLVAEPKADKRSVFEAAAKAAAGLSEKDATTPKAKKASAKKAAKTAPKQEKAAKTADAAESEDAAPATDAAAETAPASDETSSDAATAAPSADAPTADATDSAAEPAAEASTTEA